MKEENIAEVQFWRDVLALARDGEMSAVSMIANRLLPSYKPETRPIDEGLIDDSWADLNRSSQLAVIAYLTATGMISAENCAALSRALSDTTSLEIDQMMKLMNIRADEDIGDKASINSQENLYKLSTQLTDDIKQDLDKLREALTADDGDSEPHIGEDDNSSIDNDSTDDNGEDQGSE